MIFKLDIRTVIIIVLAVILFFSFDGCSRISNLLESETVVEVQKTTRIDTTETKRQAIDIKPMPDYFKPTLQKVEIKNGKIKEVPEATPIDSTAHRQVKKVNKYETISELENGTIESTLLIEGTLLGTEFKLTTKDRTITKETQTIIVRSGLFGEGQTTLGFDGRIKDIGAGITYYHKGNWYAGTGLQYDVDPLINIPLEKRTGITLKFGFKF
jgi:hypothetical protein